MQLMLYRKLLAEACSGLLSGPTVLQRYNVQYDQPISDELICELGTLGSAAEADMDENGQAVAGPNADSLSELLRYNSPLKLWNLMMLEYARTIPTPDAVGKIVRAEFRKQSDGSVMGERLFVFDDQSIDRYLAHEMDWWKGRRAARGVDVEEAYKCGMCEFADDCSWRKTKVAEATRIYRAG